MLASDSEEAPALIPIEEQLPEQPEPGTPVPVTLITGFLGAGKSTLLKHILTAQHGYRVAVIINELGEKVEDSYFLTPEGHKANLGEWVQLSNGCLCCAVKSDFVQALESLMKRRNNFDYVLIETTGLANPGPVAAALWTDEELQSSVQLDSIVTVVDALNINRELFDPRPEGVVNEAQVQIAYADIILLNKMDLVEEEAVVRAEADIRGINSTVHIQRTNHCNVNLGLVLNRNGYGRNAELSLDPIAEEGSGQLPRRAKSARRVSQAGLLSLPSSRARHFAMESHDHDHDCDDAHCTAPLHDSKIQTVVLRSQGGPLELDKFKSFIDRLLWDRNTHPEDIYRVKGVVSIADSEVRHMVQAVYELYEIFPTTQWLEGEPRESIVVIIGRNLNRAVLNEWFAACAVGASPAAGAAAFARKSGGHRSAAVAAAAGGATGAAAAAKPQQQP